MSDKKQEKTLRRKHRKEKEQRQPGKGSSAGMYRLMNSDAPLYGCWINQDWQAAGFACILLARKMSTGLLMFVMFWMNTVKGQLDECFGGVNQTEESFQRNILHREGMEFLRADLELVKELIASVVQKIEKRGEQPPERYYDCIKLVGASEKPLPTAEEKIVDTAPVGKSLPRIVYDVIDPESLEAELFQLPELQEDEASTAAQRRFVWSVPKRKFLFSKHETSAIAYLTLQGSHLVLEVLDDSQIDALQSSLVKYLGTNIALQESKPNLGLNNDRHGNR